MAERIVRAPEFQPSTRFGRKVVAPLLAVILLLLIGTGVGFLKLTGDQDERELAEDRYFAARLLDDMVSSLNRTLHDYASWGEAYENLHVRYDLDWAYPRANLGPSLYRELGVDIIALIDPAGREIYTVDRGGYAMPLTARVRGDLGHLIEQARADPDSLQHLTGKGLIDDTPILIAASAINPGGDKSVQRVPGPPSVLVMMKRLDAQTLAEAGGRALLRNLRAVHPTASAPPSTAAAVPFASADRDVALQLAWDPERPGSDIVARVRPWLAFAILAFAIVGTLLVHHGMQTADMLEETSARLDYAKRQAEFQAQHDDTTGLPNRQKLARFVDGHLAAGGDGICLLFLDLDRFKPVNDAFGHETGDRVLRGIAGRIHAALPPHSLVARVGGDEFVVAAPLTGETQVAGLAERLITTIGQPIRLEATEIVVGVSIGIAVGPADAGSFAELVRRADIALYEAKKDGRGHYRFFARHMNDAILRRKALEGDLREALARGELDVHFQPRVEIAGLAVIGAEALLRWHHPEHGDIPPAEFVAIAEETGQIGTIGAWVLERACRAAAGWPGLTVSVNVSPVQFRYDRLVPLVADVLARTHLAPHRLELEITESVLVDDRDKATEVLQALKELGVGLAIDDFGSGYSSLNYLRHYPFDKIKLDRGFLAGLGPMSETRAIVRAVIDLGRALGMTVVAEGVETWDQLLLLRLEQCPEVQGFLTGRPVSEAELTARLADDRRDRITGVA